VPSHKPELHVVTGGNQSLEQVMAAAEQAFHAGADYFHIREKHRTAREYMDWVEALATVIPLDRIVVNDRVDVAAASGCGGAHLAYHSLSPSEARRVLSPIQRIGRSVHSLDEARRAEEEGADYLFYGHVFASGSKPGLPPRGTQELAQIVKAVRIPVIAIGGIRPENVAQVLDTGCAGIAVLSGITQAENPGRATLAYHDALQRWEEKEP
jgi:thiazole tautomerase (transcriptional regulator TenI)